MTTSSPLGAPAAGLRGALLDGRLVSNLSTVSSTSLLSLQPPAGAGAGGLASPALPTTTTRASARRPRRLRWARGARLSSGACSAGCAVQPGSLRAPLMRRGAAGGDAAAHAALRASPSCPRQVADATCCSRLPCPSLPSRKHTHTHTHARTHTLLMIEYYLLFTDDWAAARRGGGRGEAAARRGGRRGAGRRGGGWCGGIAADT